MKERNSAVNQTTAKRTRDIAIAACAAGLFAGCATSGNPRDPLEGYNRAMFAVNEAVDKTTFKPLAQGYEAAVPLPARTGVANFFSNLGDAWIAVNNVLQGKPGDGLRDLGRLLVNSTLGIGGLFDVASEMGLEKHNEDLGQTFGRWGWDESAYLVLPFFGSRTVRDSLGLVGDIAADVPLDLSHVPTRNTLLGTRVVSNRAQLLPTERVIDEAATDKYAFIRDAYLQRRRSLIFDGSPPREKFDDARLPAAAYAALSGVESGTHDAPVSAAAAEDVNDRQSAETDAPPAAASAD